GGGAGAGGARGRGAGEGGAGGRGGRSRRRSSAAPSSPATDTGARPHGSRPAAPPATRPRGRRGGSGPASRGRRPPPRSRASRSAGCAPRRLPRRRATPRGRHRRARGSSRPQGYGGAAPVRIRHGRDRDGPIILAAVRVLLVGSGAREHALAWGLARSPSLDELHAAPGKPGIAALGTCHPVRADDGDGLLVLAASLAADLVVVGPEAPLVGGVGDGLRRPGVAVFGPGADAARIEGSKTFAKEVMAAAGVPTARTLEEPRAPCVVKADGLAAGKGVFVCRTREDLADGLRAAAALGR